MMNTAIVTIPHGISIDGSWFQQVTLRELNGYDEQQSAEMINYPLPFRTTVLLARVARFENGSADAATTESDNTTEIVRQLTAGDRVALMLHIRRLTFGDNLQCILSCPGCRESISLDLSVSKFLQPVNNSHSSSEYNITVDNFALKIRPVTGTDLESLSVNGDDGSNKKADDLVRSCIISSDRPLPDTLTDDLITVISTKLGELDPQADLILKLACPDCKLSFQTAFNAEDFIFQEISSRQSQLEREVHWLALNYHWSEDSILSLSLVKRKRYVDLINKTLSGESV